MENHISRILVGATGFVGSNLAAAARFDGLYHSTNVSEAYGLHPGLLVYAGLPAAKILANHAPERDRAQIELAKKNIRAIAPERLVLISTIDVFRNPVGVDEDAEITLAGMEAYGRNRRLLEIWVQETYPDALIVRLPALFGRNLKKNFLFDLLHPVPQLLTKEKWEELSEQDSRIKGYYKEAESGFWKLQEVAGEAYIALEKAFRAVGFTAKNFTDSRSRYQFYPLARLADDIGTALQARIKILHPATEPLRADEIHRFLTGEAFHNEGTRPPAQYDYRTKYADLFGGSGVYLMKKEDVLVAIRNFMEKERRKR